MTAHQDLSFRHPEVTITPMRLGEHGNGAAWRIEPTYGDSPVMYAYTDEEADRYAATITTINRR
ncbi:hypothetical protein ACIBFB_05310 [Nocardiopsis sp. NPDC050513]|uniref:hypothetical protein n=1 Tax=Nocardiopsis sp. NPDC050513 TaxID=3364338 RepID=UPI0037AE0F5C